MEGTKIRSQAQWIKEGENPTHFFFQLGNKRAAKNSFDSFFDARGVKKSSQSDIDVANSVCRVEVFVEKNGRILIYEKLLSSCCFRRILAAL